VALLLVRTHYTLLTAPGAPRQLCEEAVRRGCDHLVLCDTNNLYGLYPFAREAARVGLRALFGCELVLGARRLVLIARDRIGYRSLCALLSERHGVPERGSATGFDLPRACERHAAGLWFVCSDPQSLPELVVRVPAGQLLVGVPVLAPAVVSKPVVGKPGSGAAARSPHEPLPADTGRKLPDPAPPMARSWLLQVASDLDLPVVAVHDVWFAEPADHALHRLLLAVKWNRVLRGGEAAADQREPGMAGKHAHLPERAALAAAAAEFPAAMAQAAIVRESCQLAFAEREPPIFPPVALPPGVGAVECLRALALAGLSRCAGDRAVAISRCEHELAVIEQMGFAPYFLAVHQIADLARQRGIAFVGRGSAADSLVAYCLGLTEADPLRYGLLFERFLNPGRSDLPDIDLDFCWRRRDELLAAVYQHFGEDHVAMIATFQTCGPRAAYQEAAKALGLPPAVVAARTRLLPWQVPREWDFATAAASQPALRGDGSIAPARERLLLEAAQQLLHAPRHLGVHPGGIVITPEPIWHHAPLERAAKGVVVTQYDMHFVEGLGLVKIDLLGNRALSIVQDCVTMLRQHGQAVPDLLGCQTLPRSVPSSAETNVLAPLRRSGGGHDGDTGLLDEHDPRTAALLRQGRTLGCFQVESPAMRTLLQQMQADSMDRVIQAVALIRPGPAAAGMKDAFLSRLRGREAVQVAHPLLAEVFADTFGIMLYQEDVIRAAMAVAGLDATAADQLRRQLGKRRPATGGDSAFDAFLVAGLRRGLPRPALEQVWAEMSRFAGYSFCKAHAVTYGRLAFRCVWLKARWPAALLAAVLRNEAGYYAPGVYAEEAKRLGATLLGPCIQRGAADYELVDPHTIRIGLRVVRGLGERTVQAILLARRVGGPFRSLTDFLQRVRPARDEAENLIRVGACDELGASRPELLWRLQVAKARPGRLAEPVASGALFAAALQPREPEYPPLPDFDAEQRAAAELHLIGFTLGAHPVDVLLRSALLPSRRASGLAQCVPCGALSDYAGQQVSVCGFAVAFRPHRSEQGAMAFLTLEDGSGIVEVTLFPRVYAQCAELLLGRGPFVVRGRVEDRLGGLGLSASSLKRELA